MNEWRRPTLCEGRSPYFCWHCLTSLPMLSPCVHSWRADSSAYGCGRSSTWCLSRTPSANCTSFAGPVDHFFSSSMSTACYLWEAWAVRAAPWQSEAPFWSSLPWVSKSPSCLVSVTGAYCWAPILTVLVRDWVEPTSVHEKVDQWTMTASLHPYRSWCHLRCRNESLWIWDLEESFRRLSYYFLKIKPHGYGMIAPIK